MRFKPLFFLMLLLAESISIAYAQQPVPVGGGSYASYTPLYKSRTSERNGDQSRLTENRKLYITDKNDGKPIPTNDWWTDLLISQYSGNLWSYPQVVNAEEYGFFVAYPREWEPTGRELKWKSQIKVSGEKFKPVSADANSWHDWGIDFLMKDGNKEMLVTSVHGVPFTWVESKNLTLQLNIGTGILNDASGQEITLPFVGSKFTVDIGGDIYGIFAPEGTTFTQKDNLIEVRYQETTNHYLSIGVLPSKSDFNIFAEYAYTIPRNTTVSWDYNEPSGNVKTTWTLQTENLEGKIQKNVLQGFIPHHYKNSAINFGFTGLEYLTPRGKMKMAIGNTFDITYKFNGMLPFLANPLTDDDLKNPYQKERMKQMISDYANKGGFGADTYWGGKGLIQMAMYMTFANEMGETELFEKCKTRLKDALTNWLTYTPDENNYFFARYQRWGALVGYDTSYDSDTFNDHHFHYGYFTLASGILALFDEDFKTKYGEMATLLVKDYANWDRNDNDFPLFRTLDPWSGHSYAGGLGGGNGNGQESTSEAMQSWAGMYMLGVATGNKEMRDAGIFGWTLEARGTAEYWFDRDKENIDYTRFDKPYNSNLTSQGIGWWTWFSGDPVWMHSIQWLPITPGLKYLYEDLAFAEWDYTQMWDFKDIQGWETKPGIQSALSDESGLGNVVLSYLQIFNPDSAAAVFDTMWDAQMPVVKNTDTGGISYFITHSHRSYGDICWDINADVPTATTYKHPITGVLTYMVYNSENSERKVKFFKNGSEILEIKVPANKLTVYADNPIATQIEVTAPNNSVVAPSTNTTLKAVLLDQYGATMDATFSWSTSGNGTVLNSGVFTAPNSIGESTVSVATAGLSKNITLKINSLPELTTASLLPADGYYLEKGNTVNFSLEMKDQYDQSFLAPVDWEIFKGSEKVKSDSVLNVQEVGIYTIKATVGTKSYSNEVYVTPKFRNIASGKTAYSSSEENPGTLTESVIDGDRTTRWGSAHSDDQWVYVDLQTPSFISYLSLVWEASYATLYEIQVSNDALNWETIKTVNGLGKTEIQEINKTARYIKIQGLERSSTYGYSLYEFEVYGVPPIGTTPVLFGIDVTPSFAQLKEGESKTLTAKGYDQFGDEFPITPQFVLQDGEGLVSSEGEFTATKYGTATVQVKVGDFVTTTNLLVEESIKLASVQILPKQTSLIKGESISFTTIAKDQFGVDFPSTDLAYEIIQGSNGSLIGNTFTSNSIAQYKIRVSNDGSVKDTAIVTVDELTATNLALNKPVSASSYENDGTLPQFVNDGKTNTRWGSAFKDNEYIQVDLLDVFVVNKIKLFWDNSYAPSYQISVSTDEITWSTAYTTTAGQGLNEVLDIEPAAARYIRVLSLQRSSAYGASINELEVYGTNFWTNPEATSIVLNPNPLLAYLNTDLAITANVLDQYQLPYSSNEVLVWYVNGGGTVNQQGVFTPQNVGEYTLSVSYGSLTANFPITVKSEKVLDKLSLTAASVLLTPNELTQLNVVGYDQYGDVFNVPADLTWSTSGGTVNVDRQFSATSPSLYEVTVMAGSVSAIATIEVYAADNQNLALRKPIEVSSGTNAAFAVDGDINSRWESIQGSDNEWFIVDLEDAYHLTKVQVLWETASAEDYEIQASKDKQSWTTLRTVAGITQTGNRTDEWIISGMGRYIRVKGIKRLTQWGYSVFEFRAYGKRLQSLEPYTVEFINPTTQIIDNNPIQYTVKVFDKDHVEITNPQLQWNVSGVGNISANGLFTSNIYGRADISVSSKHATASISVIYDPQAALAIAYIQSFNATIKNSVVNINWKLALGTSSGNQGFETANSSFVLERSTDGVKFEQLTNIKLSEHLGSINYDYIDRKPATGINYYKLSHVDADGNKIAFGIKAVNFSLSPSEIIIHPNPTSQYLNVQGDQIKSIAIFSMKGTLELQTSQSNKIDVSHLSNGVYIIRIDKEGGLRYTSTIIIAH